MPFATKEIYAETYREIKERLQFNRVCETFEHDELVLEVPADEVDTVSVILKETMEQTVRLSVPLDIDIHKGKNWAEAK